MLVFYARQGKRVVRLKGGDPFVFGRGGEEYSHLQKNHIPCRVIPGSSSAIAAPASAGIPVTDRRHAASFRVISGNAFTEETAGNLAWEDLARGSDTLVVLMGMATLPLLTRKLMAHGRAPETPAALIQEGTTPRQRQARATLGTLAEVAVREALSNPAVIVIGEVAALGR
jgi:uroporphyrin-III C-methyltransferase